METKFKVALIQLYEEPLQAEENFKKSRTFIESAAKQGARLAVLPEYHLSGWEPDHPEFLRIAAKWHEYLSRYCELAKELRICIVPGTLVQTEENESGKPNLYNASYFINDEGQILGKYVKKNLWHTEREHLTSSQHNIHDAFDTQFGKVGLLICWDLGFPEAFRELISQGAKLIIITSYWDLDGCNQVGLGYNPASEKLFINSALTTRAFENTCAIIFVNAGGPAESRFAGLSQVTVPFVGPLACLGASPEGMLVVDLDLAVLDAAEDSYKVRQDLARSDWHYKYRPSNKERETKLEG